MFGQPAAPQALPPAAAQPLPAPPPPQTQPGQKPGRRAPANPTIIGNAGDFTRPIGLMGPGNLGGDSSGSRTFLG